eukprot:543989_1
MTMESKLQQEQELANINTTNSNNDLPKLIEEHDRNQYVSYQLFEQPVIPLIVRVGCTLYDMSSFDITEGTVHAVFDLWLVYDDKIFHDTFANTTDGKLPISFPNILELNEVQYRMFKMYGNDLDALNIWTKKRKTNDECNDQSKTFTIEMRQCNAILKLNSTPGTDPFLSIFFFIKLSLDGTPGSEMTVFKISSGDCYFPGCRKKLGSFTLGSQTMREFRITASYGEYSRLYFIFEYTKSPYEDIAKYYILPLLINLFTIGYYNTVESLFDSAGTYFLAIIALLFTLPETGAFTKNEKAVVCGSVWMLIVMLVLLSEPGDASQLILWVSVLAFYCILLIYDYISAKRMSNKWMDFLFHGDLRRLDAVDNLSCC